MRKLFRTLAAALVSALLIAGTAAAQTSISNTGPDSTNTITQDNSFDCDVDNNTDIGLDFNNDQNASSGDATNSGNTSGGSATTGNASNDSSNSVNIGVNNSGMPCIPNVPGVVSNPPAVGGQGGGEQQVLGSVTGGRGAVLAAGTTITALPETGTTTTVQYVVGSIALLSALAFVGRASVGLRRELAL